MSERPTPETGAAEQYVCTYEDKWESHRDYMVDADFARRLERERDAARQDIGLLKQALENKTARLMQYEESLNARDIDLAKARGALRLCRMALDQRITLDGRIALNGPTIGEVIDAAFAAQEQS